MADRKSSRREFLRGKSGIEAAADLVQSLVPSEPNSLADADPVGGDSYLLRIGRTAMACEFEVMLNVGQYPHGTAAAVEALDLVDRLESQLTVYRSDSEVSQLNRRAADEAVALELGLFALLQYAIELYRQTDRAYDITAGPLSKVWGFFRRAGTVPSQSDLERAHELVGSDKLQLDDSERTVRFLVDGMEINLGSIGKGYALDRSAAVLQGAGIEHFLLHGGQSSVLARGSRGHHDGGKDGWWLGIRDPWRPTRRLAEIRVRDAALATSGSAVQFFEHEGKRYGHIIDPRTGWPAEGTLSASVIAPTAAAADALSTAAFVLGREAALAFFNSRPELGLVLFSPGPQPGSYEVALSGIADQDLRWL